jgi:hypothetical protein
MAKRWTLGGDAADPHGASIVDPDGELPAIGFLRSGSTR